MNTNAYVPRRKRRRLEPPSPLSESNKIQPVECGSLTLGLTKQEASWVRQERKIVVGGEDPIPPPIQNFSELTLSSNIISVLQSRGVSKPSAVQAQALPCISHGRDVIVLAPTGSGKTLCYILPVLQMLQQLQCQSGFEFQQYSITPNNSAAPCALIIVPTRELVDQVLQDLSEFFPGRLHPPVVGICGGIDLNDQLTRLSQHCHDIKVVVATPGRLLHLALRHGATLTLEQVSLLVVDEVDRVLEIQEMETQLREILQLANTAGRQTLLLSATLPNFLPRLARSAVFQPVTIHVEETSLRLSAASTNNSSSAMLAITTASNVVHDVQYMRPAEKLSRLLRVLRATEQPPVLVFCNFRSGVEYVARQLHSEQFHVAPLHGGQSQGYRTQVMRAFRAGYVDVLVATDLVSRGLDFPGVNNVVLFDIPSTIEDYVHRCGRTGRHPGGETGISNVTGKVTSFLTRECTIATELKQVLQALGQHLPRELDIPRRFSST